MDRIKNLLFTSSGSQDHASGLLGWLRFTIDPGLVIDGIALRRTLDGRVTLSFPRRTGRDGTHHQVIAPVDDEARRAIEAAVFEALGLAPEVAS